MCRSRLALAFLLAALGAVLPAVRLAAPALAAAEASSEEDLLRQVKSDVFDENWQSVLGDCDRLIAAYPGSAAMPRMLYYRARALANLPGRESEALDAYAAFIERYPDDPLREDAWTSRLGLAKSLWLRGKKDAITILTKALDQTGYPRIYASIQISYTDNRPARARALPILQECSKAEEDPEVRNECTLGILRIDPSAVPRPPASSPTSAQGGSATVEPKLIRLEVRERTTGKVTVAVNLPIAFAEALLGSLSEVDQGQVMAELKRRNIDVANIWRSLRTLGAQTLVQIETEDANIRIWLE